MDRSGGTWPDTRRQGAPRAVAWLGIGLALGAGGPSAAQTLSLPPPLAASAPAPKAPPKLHPHARQLLVPWLSMQREYERIPAWSVALANADGPVFARGFGFLDAARRVPAASDSIYGICSISKLFTSIAVMQQWEAGRLHLDDDVGTWLPWFTIEREAPQAGPISVELLLSHGSGLPREAPYEYWTGGYTRDGFPSREALREGLARQRVERAPGERLAYSNLGMSVLGELVEARAGMPYGDWVHARILRPLALRDTRIGFPAPGDAAASRVATGFSNLSRDGVRQSLPSFDARGMAPAYGFTSTVDDLAALGRWQLRLRRSGAEEVLKASTLRKMQRPHFVDADGKRMWGLGFWFDRSEGAPVLTGHDGVCPGHRSALATALDEGWTVAVAQNASGAPNPVAVARSIVALVKKAAALKDGDTPPAGFAEYFGRYAERPWLQDVLVVPWGKDLGMLVLPTLEPAKDMVVLRQVAPDRFESVSADGGRGTTFWFERDAQGRVLRYRVGAVQATREGPLDPT